jgi:hypothetical protein
MSTRLASLALLCVFALPLARAADPFLKPNDVIALVGGEDMVAASEYGYLELLLQRALPQHHLKVRSLAWEGDTVFEQPRDLNYPSLEQQLDDLGATVVIMQFGQMESLAGTSKLPEFIKAYEKLIERVGAGGKRRVVLVEPFILDKPVVGSNEYPRTVRDLASRLKIPCAPASTTKGEAANDGMHLNPAGHIKEGFELSVVLSTFRGTAQAGLAPAEGEGMPSPISIADSGAVQSPEHEKIRQIIAAKNRLWFNYTRPQNWAFLNGDRTEQPSSRDHLDPSKRWFPEEMKQWLPLIDTKEKEIWDLAAKASSESAKETKPSK